jgi:hypothetical protein
MDTNDNGVMVAATILQQIGGNRAMMMIGGRAILSGNALIIGWKATSRANWAQITYDAGADLYNMNIGKMRNGQVKSLEFSTGLYADQLKPVFEKATGLYLSL